MERILCAAVHVDDGIYHKYHAENVPTGIVIAGYRHRYLHEIFIYKFSSKFTDGFLTSWNRFVNREEAFEIAEKAGQIKPDADEYETRTLISEDLY